MQTIMPTSVRLEATLPPRTPTDAWLATIATDMPPLTGPEGTAERLLLLLHYGIDWNHSWPGRYRNTYWDHLLPDRVLVATYRAGTLGAWWTDVATELSSTPRNTNERLELAALLRAEPRPVLETLRTHTEELLLRVRIVTEAVRATRNPTHTAPRIGN